MLLSGDARRFVVLLRTDKSDLTTLISRYGTTAMWGNSVLFPATKKMIPNVIFVDVVFKKVKM